MIMTTNARADNVTVINVPEVVGVFDTKGRICAPIDPGFKIMTSVRIQSSIMAIVSRD